MCGKEATVMPQNFHINMSIHFTEHERDLHISVISVSFKRLSRASVE